MTLDQFLKDNRAELIQRARAKVADRSSPPADPAELEHGVPLFLSQLSDTLADQGGGGTDHSTRATRTAEPSITESAARHGRDLLKFGFTIEQVVHDYGDVCQAVTELAEARGATLSIAEFHTLNRCLDNAMADAVASFGSGRQTSIDLQVQSLQQRLAAFAVEYQRLTEIAVQSFTAINTGNIGVSGATGALLAHTLEELSVLKERALPDISLAPPSAKVATA